MSIFRFKEFEIDQSKSPFKVGTDGVLIGALTNVENFNSILDVGTGTGLIALMLAQRCKAQIDAIELNKQAFEQAKVNFKNSPWNNRISIHHTSLQEFCPKQKYDLIVSNPPFFQNAKKSGIEGKDHARHTDTLSLSELLTTSSKFINSNGCIAVIYPTEFKQKLIDTASKIGLFLKRIIIIKPTPDKEPKRIFIEFTHKQNNTLEQELIIEEFGRHQYSNEYIKLTKDFYLNL